MNTLEQAPHPNEVLAFGMDFGMADFDINAAFQEAVAGIASDDEIALEEMVLRMEAIVNEGTSEIYRDFIDFRQLAAQIQMMCNHNHAFNQSLRSNDTLSGFMDSLGSENKKHDHNDSTHDKHSDDEEEDDDEIDSKDRKKSKNKRRRIGWLFFSA